MTQTEVAQRMLKAASIGLIQSLNNRGCSDAQIQQAVADYPALLQKRASDRFANVCQVVHAAICGASR